MTEWLTLLTLGFSVAVVGTWAARALAVRLDFYNRPNPIVAQHRRPVPYLGGLGLFAAWLAALIYCATAGGLTPPLLTPIAVGVVGFLAFGVLDDARPFAPAPKFAGQVVLAGVPVTLGLTPVISGIWLLDASIGLFFVLVLVNAFNFTDVCDGLLCGLCMVAFTFVAIAFEEVRGLALGTAAASAGVLVFNRPPARIFLGDGGSHVLGFLAASLAIAVSHARSTPVPLLVTGVAAGVPLFELVFISVVRIRKGLAWWRGSPDHFALRLQAAGLTATETDLLACTAGGVLGAASLAVERLEAPMVAAILAALFLAASAVGIALFRIDRPRSQGTHRASDEGRRGAP